MDRELLEDLEASHSVLNYLYSVFQGRHAYYDILSHLRSPEFRSGELVMTKSSLDRIQSWIDALYKETPLLSVTWETLETTDANAAFDLLAKTKVELIDLSEKVEAILSIADYSSDKSRVALMTAAFGRFAYSRNYYVNGYIEFFNTFGQPELEREYQQLVPQAEWDLQLSDSFVQIINGPERPTDELFKDLREESLNLPGIFRASVHDINQLISSYENDFTFELAEIPAGMAAEWGHLQVPPTVAGYWHAYRFRPKEAQPWLVAGIQDPGLASAYRIFGFPFEEAVEWLELRISPRTARQFRDSGHTPEQAAQAIAQEMQQEPEASG